LSRAVLLIPVGTQAIPADHLKIARDTINAVDAGERFADEQSAASGAERVGVANGIRHLSDCGILRGAAQMKIFRLHPESTNAKMIVI